jgi:hypothetical protein
MPQKDLHSRTGRDETKRNTQERMERRSGNRYSCVGSEKMERVGDRKGQMERYCSTGQSPQRAVAPTEEEDLRIRVVVLRHFAGTCCIFLQEDQTARCCVPRDQKLDFRRSDMV